MSHPQREELLAGLDWHPVQIEEFESLPEEERLHRIRHSAAHVMASAVEHLHAPVEFATGPATEQGFFYDMRLKSPLTMDDLGPLQEEMDRIVAAELPFEVSSIPREKALEVFADQQTKLDILERIPDPDVTVYRHGDFLDLCAGPHVPHTGYCRNARLLNVSAAHWRGEEEPSLTRVSGTAWSTPKDLRAYLRFVEEARKRDHRVLGPRLGLFSFHPWAASALWHPRGVTFRRELLRLWGELMEEHGYVEIVNPVLYQKELFETSGHWDHFQENMFIVRDGEGEPRWVLKPMNCPDTMLYFRTSSRSYRDLPMRVAETQVLHRNEASGTIHGIMRTRSFIQDDAHIFLAPEHIHEEISGLMGLVDRVYGMFGLDYSVALSTRPEGFMGEAALWDEAENGLRSALEAAGVGFTVDEGEGAFYGPKIDISVRDSLGRDWQCGTVQLDFQQPMRFDLRYSAADGSLQRPIVIHRAVFGSFERFMGILVEHLGGAFPTWLAPVQCVVLPISEKQAEYARRVLAALEESGLRAELDLEGSVNQRVRAAETRKIPYMLVAGDRESGDGTLTVRRHRQKEQRNMPLAEVLEELKTRSAERTLDVDVERASSPLLKAPRSRMEERAY